MFSLQTHLLRVWLGKSSPPSSTLSLVWEGWKLRVLAPRGGVPRTSQVHPSTRNMALPNPALRSGQPGHRVPNLAGVCPAPG